MSQQTVCDGCGTPLTPKDGTPLVVISGERMNGLRGGGLPDGRFDWCGVCAGAAFRAVHDAQFPGCCTVTAQGGNSVVRHAHGPDDPCPIEGS